MLVSKAFSQHEERTLARKHALQLMYQGEILEKTPRELIDNGQLVPETQGLGVPRKTLKQSMSLLNLQATTGRSTACL